MSEQHVMVRSMRSCFLYSAHMTFRQPPTVESNFVQLLRKTVANSSRDVAEFVATYGTHYLTDIQMGYRNGVDLIIHKNKVSSSHSRDEKTQVSVGVNVKKFSFGITKSDESSSQRSSQQSQEITKRYKFTMGTMMGGREATAGHISIEDFSFVAPLRYKVKPMSGLQELSANVSTHLNQIYWKYVNDHLMSSIAD